MDVIIKMKITNNFKIIWFFIIRIIFGALFLFTAKVSFDNIPQHPIAGIAFMILSILLAMSILSFGWFYKR